MWRQCCTNKKTHRTDHQKKILKKRKEKEYKIKIRKLRDVCVQRACCNTDTPLQIPHLAQMVELTHCVKMQVRILQWVINFFFFAKQQRKRMRNFAIAIVLFFVFKKKTISKFITYCRIWTCIFTLTRDLFGWAEWVFVRWCVCLYWCILHTPSRFIFFLLFFFINCVCVGNCLRCVCVAHSPHTFSFNFQN